MLMRRLLVTVALLATGCASSGQDGDRDTTTRAPFTTAPTTTSTTIEPASGLAPEPSAVAGIWAAKLGEIVLQFRLDTGPADEVKGVFDSPVEGVTDIPASVTVDGADVTIEISAINAVFEGTVNGDSMTGRWEQGGATIPLVFTREEEAFAFTRPQEPQPPFPYETHDITFTSGNDTFGGTLTIPEGDGPFSAAVLVNGSGPQDRDSTLLGHKPFLVLADWLTRHGIATLRYDDRGVGQSTGDPIGATTAHLAEDARAAAEYLATREEVGAIGIIGHSEGGLIGPMVAADSPAVAFVVMLAGPGLPGSDVLLTQTEELLRAEGLPEEAISWQTSWVEQVIAAAVSELDTADLRSEVRAILTTAAEDVPEELAFVVGDTAIQQAAASYTDPWMRHFLQYDPRPALGALDIPTLALIGDLDLQVSSANNLPEIEAALVGNLDATVVEMPSLNHLFQTAETGAGSEYATIEETLAPVLLETIRDWMLERF